MDNRRKEDRKYIKYFSRVTNRESGELLGYLVDMTTGGALMIGNQPLRANTLLDLRLDLPEGRFQEEHLDLEALAVWSQPDEDPELYRTGLRLVENDPKVFLILTRLLSSYGLD